MTNAQGAERGSYGPEDRHLLETAASRIYSNAVQHGWLPDDDARLHEDRRQPALDLLLDIGLLRHDEVSNRYVPTDPAAVQAQIVVPLGQRGADLLAESARWADTFSELGQVFRTSPRATVNPITEIHGLDNINNFIAATVNDCRQDLLTAQPHGRRPANTLAQVEDRDVKTLERGVRMRTLYQHSARHSPATREYVSDITSHGAEVRTLDEFFRRLIVIDRQVAIVPASDNHHVAIAIYEKSLIAYLVDIFERAWERAQPFNVSGSQAERHIAEDVRAMTIRLLVEGHSDPASAKRLGVSTRTYAGYIAALKDEYDVQTRFQLGYAMGRDTSQRSLPSSEAPGDDVDDLEDDGPDGER
ncbi:MAG: LuxR family transcriptional regulator [Nocardioides sp.]